MSYKIIRNTTASPIVVNATGDTIPANNGTLTIYPQNYGLWASAIEDPANTALRAYFTAGQLESYDGVTYLTGQRAIDYLKHPDWAFNQRFLSEPERSNGFISKNTQEAIEEGRNSFTGKGLQMTFLENGTSINTWLKCEDSTTLSSESTPVIRHKVRLVGIGMSNKNDDVDPIILFAIANYNNGASIDRSYKWTLSNVRTAIKTNPTLGFTLNPGDKLALYCADNGGNASDIVITLDFIVLESTTQNFSENFSDDFEFSDFPTISSIPEIFT